MTLAEELLDSTVERTPATEADPEERDFEGLKRAVGDMFGVDVAELDDDSDSRASSRKKSPTRCGRRS